MKRGFNFFLVLVIIMFLTSFISAGTLKIQIITLEDHSININFLNPDRSSGGVISYGNLNEETGDGSFTLVFQDNSELFDLSVFLLKDGKTILHEEFNAIKNNQEILLFLSPTTSYITESYVPESTSNISVENNSNISSEESTSIETELANEEETIEENSISEEETNSNNLGILTYLNRSEVYYALGGFLLLIVLAFVFGAVLKHHRLAISKGDYYGFSKRDPYRREKEILEEIDEFEDKIIEYDDRIRNLRRELKEIKRVKRDYENPRKRRYKREYSDYEKPKKRIIKRVKSTPPKEEIVKENSEKIVSKLNKEGYLEVSDVEKKEVAQNKEKITPSDRMAEARRKLAEDQIEAARLKSLRDKKEG